MVPPTLPRLAKQATAGRQASLSPPEEGDEIFDATSILHAAFPEKDSILRLRLVLARVALAMKVLWFYGSLGQRPKEPTDP
jgi:hypothetical protein